jgi:drug/metabolite transporter (DMT)-like permease
MQQRPLTESRFLAIALTCAASLLFAFLDTSAKYLSTVAHVPLLEIIWVRFVVNALLIVAMLGPNLVLRALPSKKLMNQLLRSVFLIGATAFNFLALQYLQLDQTATIFFLSPFIVAALAGPMLGEWIGWHRLLAICVGFTGVLFVTRPGFGGIHWAVSFSLLATLSYALYILWTRYIVRFDNASTTLVYTPLAGAVFVAPFALANWQTPANLWVWFVLLSTGVFGGLGHWLVILAHERAPAPILAPFGYISIIFMIALGQAVFADVPSLWTLAGAAVIILSGVYLLFRERYAPGSAPAASSTVVEG